MCYNVFTFTDGALRVIVLLFFVSLGFDALSLAIMFSLYEVAGVVTNLMGGVVGSKHGMRYLLFWAIALQTVSIALLALVETIFPDYSNPATRNTIAITAYVVVAQGLSGVAKDLMKIQGKSIPKLCTKGDDNDRLFHVIATLTGMKNSLKGVGYLLGSVLVWGAGYVGALCIQGGLIVSCLPFAVIYMENNLGMSPEEQKCIDQKIFKKDANVNVLSAARFFLFGAREVWFEIAAPVFFRIVLGWVPYGGLSSLLWPRGVRVVVIMR